ncbi:hypothetical protein BH23GEM9_BH23GEM9_23200 [soil metagenome]
MIRHRALDLLRGPLRPRIVVTGMPKSGTTAVAMLLGAAAGLKVNSDPFHRLDRAGVDFRDGLYAGALPLHELLRRHRRFFRGGLVKDPNFIHLPAALEALGSAGWVFVVRDPRHNIRSLLNRLGLPGRIEQGARLENISPTWRRVLDGRTPDVPGTNHIERLAHRWALAARSYAAAADRMVVIRYESFVTDKAAAVEATLHDLGIPGGRSIEQLADRQFQPRGQRGVTPAEFFGPDELASIERICKVDMQKLGYTVS